MTDAGKAKLDGRRRPVAQPRVAGLDLDPRLDDLHQGPDRRLQGPGRVAPRSGTAAVPRRSGRQPLSTKDASPNAFQAVPPSARATPDSRPGASMTAADPRRHRCRQALRRRRRPARRLAVGPARRGPRADGRQRRRQVDARQDPDRRRPPRRRPHPGPRPAPRHPLARRRPPRRPRPGLPGAVADPRPRRRRQPPPHRHARRALPRLGRASSASPTSTSASPPATSRSPSSACSTSPARSPSSPTCSSSTR